jgi:hypothetical protein
MTKELLGSLEMDRIYQRETLDESLSALKRSQPILKSLINGLMICDELPDDPRITPPHVRQVFGAVYNIGAQRKAITGGRYDESLRKN